MGKELPILFNADMVRAILDDIKGCTRRAVKGFIPNDAKWGYTIFTPKGHISCRGMYKDGYDEKFFKLPCEKGDILYVRETTWQMTAHSLEVDGETRGYFLPNFRYVATDTKPEVGWDYSWVKRPSIHMPKEAARIFLKVTDVRVERLQDMNLDDFLSEGTSLLPEAFNDPENAYMQTKSLFVDLWDSTINTQKRTLYGWDANPWVWVIEFKRYEKPKEETNA